MFQPPVFREERTGVMHALMRAHPFATVVSSARGQLNADHVPLVLHAEDPEALGTLRGHFAAANPLVRDGGPEDEVLAVFQGPQRYISPGWYPSKHEHGKAVPTWNYAVVHARGTLQLIRDEDWLLSHLEALTNTHETGRAQPWRVHDAPKDYIAKQMRALAGFEIRITALEGKWKVSQNKSEADRQGVAEGLAAEPGGAAMAQLVEGRRG